MELTINGEKREFSNAQLSIAELLEHNNVEMPEMVSVQHNGEFVDRSVFSSTLLNHGDEIEFLYFMGGGR